MTERAAKLCAHGDCPHAVPRHGRLEGRQARRILRRDIVCQVCLNKPANEVDHITPGDDHSPENLQGICTDCHRAKTAREANAARNGQ